MEIPFDSFRLNITVSRAIARQKGWEEFVAVGLDDLELARLNRANTRDPVHSPWEGVRWLYGLPR